jgi:hypothetical protein
VKAIVVYESLWGNTAAVARAVAEGIGPGAVALSTAEATDAEVAGAGLLFAGAPILGFNLPTEQIRKSIAADRRHAGNPADLAHPSMRDWLGGLPQGSAACAAFETRIRWSPGSSAKRIAEGLEAVGFRRVAEPERFLVAGKYGPLKDGELERARRWGAALAEAAKAATAD